MKNQTPPYILRYASEYYRILAGLLPYQTKAFPSLAGAWQAIENRHTNMSNSTKANLHDYLKLDANNEPTEQTLVQLEARQNKQTPQPKPARHKPAKPPSTQTPPPPAQPQASTSLKTPTPKAPPQPLAPQSSHALHAQRILSLLASVQYNSFRDLLNIMNFTPAERNDILQAIRSNHLAYRDVIAKLPSKVLNELGLTPLPTTRADS